MIFWEQKSIIRMMNEWRIRKRTDKKNLFITYKVIGAIVSLANLTDNDNLEASISQRRYTFTIFVSFDTEYNTNIGMKRYGFHSIHLIFVFFFYYYFIMMLSKYSVSFTGSLGLLLLFGLYNTVVSIGDDAFCTGLSIDYCNETCLSLWVVWSLETKYIKRPHRTIIDEFGLLKMFS